jgi:hypothetical protein
MSDRERWTIYPLLFLALALGLRDRLIPPDPPADMTLRELTIVGEDNRANIRLTGADKKGKSPSIQILNAQGSPSWLATVVPRTGVAFQETSAIVARDVRVVGPDGKPRVVIAIGQDDAHSGVVEWLSDEGKQLILAGGGSVVAHDVRVVGPDGKPRVVIGVGPDAEHSGVIEWFTKDGVRLLVAGGGTDESGAITSYRHSVEQFSVGSNQNGTIIVARGSDGKAYLVMACEENGTGRGLLFDREGNGHLLIGQPVAIKLNEVDSEAPSPKKPAVDQPADDESPSPEESEEKSDSPSDETSRTENDTDPQDTPPTP